MTLSIFAVAEPPWRIGHPCFQGMPVSHHYSIALKIAIAAEPFLVL